MASGDISIQIDRIFHLIRLLSTESLKGPQIVKRLAAYYENSGTRLLRTDIGMLNAWGFDISNRYHPSRCYELRYNPLAAVLNDDHLDALSLIREMFGSEHPLGQPFQRMLQLLTIGLTEEQLAIYQQQPFMRVSLKMATTYPHLEQLIPPLKFAINGQKQVQFQYRPLDSREQPICHRVDPYEIEYHQQHLYLVGYAYQSQSILDFRLDQIVPASVQTLPVSISDPERNLHPYVFHYRLAAKLARRGISERFVDQTVIQTFHNGDVEIKARARSQFYALRGLLRYADSASALAPHSLVTEMKETLDRMRTQYED